MPARFRLPDHKHFPEVPDCNRKTQSMKIIFLVPRLDKASTRYRMLQYLPFLEREGIEYAVKPLSRTSRRWVSLIRELKRADVVFVQKKLFRPFELMLVRQAARRLVYDFDDAVMFKDGPASERQHARQRKRFVATVRKADRVIAGNRYLQEQTRLFQERIAVIPTPLNMKHYTEKERKESAQKQVVLGWIGSKGTLKYLKKIVPALENLGRRCPWTKLKIVADDFFDLEHLEVVKKKWSSAEEIADLHSFDIGLMPLTEDVWTRGKCGFKLLQCMGVGLPVVCSPVGMNREIVTNGVEGFWATTQDEWLDKLELLVKNQTLRVDMGQKGRAKVLQRYSLEVTAPLLLRLLQQA